MNGGTGWRGDIGSGDRPIRIQSVNVFVDRCQLLLAYEWVPGLAQLVERYASFGFGLHECGERGEEDGTDRERMEGGGGRGEMEGGREGGREVGREVGRGRKGGMGREGGRGKTMYNFKSIERKCNWFQQGGQSTQTNHIKFMGTERTRTQRLYSRRAPWPLF